MDYTLVTGLGRSGSKWLATFLGELRPPEIHVGHEILFKFDIAAWDAVALGTLKTEEFWEERRALLAKNSGSDRIIEVNSVPRYFLEGFHKVFPKGKISLLMRDPRNVVPSIAERGNYSDLDRMPAHRRPDPNWVGFQVPSWRSVPRLSKICWVWATSNQAVQPHATHHMRLEDLLKSYEEIIKVCQWCGVPPNREVWENLRSRKVNAGDGRCPSFEKWTEDEQKDLYKICGDVMKTFGYY